MKRLSLIATLLIMIPVSSCAQWYLFPGKKQKAKDDIKQEFVEPVVKEEEKKSEHDTLITIDHFFFDPMVHLNLILPLKSESEKPSDNFLELYAGALIAARDLGEAGYKLELNIIDINADADYMQGRAFALGDVNIGPISEKDIKAALPYLSENKVIISPLDQRVALLAEDGNIVQSPTPWEAQMDELISWLSEELQAPEELILIRDSTANGQGEKCAYMINALERKGLKYRSVRRMGELEMTKNHSYRVIIASESDAFVTGAARSVAIEAARKTADNVILYCTSRVRGIKGIDANVSDLHDASAHLTAAYHIDYDNPDVKAFVLAYRALYNSEPGSFAFQGYDLVNYYVRACAQYGRAWPKRLPNFKHRGLQSDFRFYSDYNAGRVNAAARRVLYQSDYSTIIVN